MKAAISIGATLLAIALFLIFVSGVGERGDPDPQQADVVDNPVAPSATVAQDPDPVEARASRTPSPEKPAENPAATDEMLLASVSGVVRDEEKDILLVQPFVDIAEDCVEPLVNAPNGISAEHAELRDV